MQNNQPLYVLAQEAQHNNEHTDFDVCQCCGKPIPVIEKTGNAVCVNCLINRNITFNQLIKAA